MQMQPEARLGLSIGDGAVAAGCAVTLLALLLPWWDSGIGASANGFHDWGWLSFFGLALVIAVLLARVAGGQVHLPIDDAAAYMVCGSLELLGAVVFWFGNNTSIGGRVRYGVFLGVVGGAVTLIGGYVRRMEYLRSSAPPGAE
jgi:hypothetical protein